MTTLHIAKPKKTIGIVSLAVKPRAITPLTVDASGGASISADGDTWSQHMSPYGLSIICLPEHQYAQ
jgi:hypothetical protein